MARSTRRGRIRPARLRRGATGCMQRVAMAVHVPAGPLGEARRSFAIRGHGRERGARTEHHLGGRVIADDVTGRIPAIRDDVTLGARDLGAAMRGVSPCRCLVGVTRHARGRTLDVAVGAVDSRRAAAKVCAVARGTDRDVPVTSGELRPVKVRARLVEDPLRVHPAAVGARGLSITFCRAAHDNEQRERAGHGWPWNRATSHSLPSPWQVAHDSAPSTVVFTSACAAT